MVKRRMLMWLFQSEKSWGFEPMCNYLHSLLFSLCLFISFNGYSGDNAPGKRVWLYQSVLGERVIFKESNGSISKQSYDVINTRMECFDERFVLCLQSSDLDIAIPHELTEMWQSDWSTYHLVKDKLTINLLGTEIEDYMIFQSIKKHILCKTTDHGCGTYIFYSYKHGPLGFDFLESDKWRTLYLSNQACNLGGTCLAKAD